MADEWNAKHIGLGVGVIALAAVGFWQYEVRVQPKVDAFETTIRGGRAAGAVVSGDVLLLLDRVEVTRREHVGAGENDEGRRREESRLRLKVVDLETGTSLGTHLLPFGGCVAASPGRVWCDLDGLALYTAKTMTRVLAVEPTIANAKRGKPIAGVWRIEGARAVQLLDDGRVAILDAATGRVSASDDVPQSLRRDAVSGMPPSAGTINHTSGVGCGVSARLGTAPTPPISGSDFYPPGAKKQRVGAAPPAAAARWTIEASNSDRGYVVRGAVRSTESFLRPALVSGADHDEPSPIVLHHRSLDPSNDSVQLTRIAANGSAVWSFDLASATCESITTMTTTTPPTLLVTTDNAKRRAVVLDPATGASRWTVAF